MENSCRNTSPSKPNVSASMSSRLGFQSTSVHCRSAARKMVVMAARSMLQSGSWL
uniref:Uncharacterized protein n=2 Tax=Arundo donax TaxID=35708 RepID=A0A0A9FDY0_ARUDO